MNKYSGLALLLLSMACSDQMLTPKPTRYAPVVSGEPHIISEWWPTDADGNPDYSAAASLRDPWLESNLSPGASGTYDAHVTAGFWFTATHGYLNVTHTVTKGANVNDPWTAEDLPFDGPPFSETEVRKGFHKTIFSAYCGVVLSSVRADYKAEFQNNYGQVWGTETAHLLRPDQTIGPACESPSITMCAAPTSVAAGQAVTCTATIVIGSGGLKWAEWKRDDAHDSWADGLTPTWTWTAQPGTHWIELKVENLAGFDATAMMTFYVEGEDVFEQNSGGESSSGCAPEDEYFWWHWDITEERYRYMGVVCITEIQ